MSGRLLLPLLLAVACASPTSAPALRHLDRPADVSFACIGFNSNVVQAVSPAYCSGFEATADAGVEDATFVGYSALGFVIEQVRGDVAIANLGLNTFVDSDKFAPGLNGLPVGRLPASAATTSNGCHVTVANSGSCDLSLVNVVNAFLSRPNAVSTVEIKSTSGRILSRPTEVVTPPYQPEGAPPEDCTNPSGIAFVTFPGCNLVARVDLSNGNMLDGIRYREGAPPEVVGPDVTCPIECRGEVTALPGKLPQEADAGVPDAPLADAGPADAGVDAVPVPAVNAHPVNAVYEPDGTKLYIGAHDSPALLIVDLDPAGKPLATRQLLLEGIQGIKKLAATGDVPMGEAGIGGIFRFVYAIGVDQAIHVADVTPGREPRECDTQIDRRFLHDEGDVGLLSCLPIGGPETPPRRADAEGPGIRLPRGVAPIDLGIFRSSLEIPRSQRPQPEQMGGVFALVATKGPVADARVGRGAAYFINIDDDNYEDFEIRHDIDGPDIALAIPHSLRDGNLQRRVGRASCAEPNTTLGNLGPARLMQAPEREGGFIYADSVGADIRNTLDGEAGDPFAPGLHRVPCDTQVILWSLQMFTPPEIHGSLFADLERVAPRTILSGSGQDETFQVTWEGLLAFEASSSRKAGGRAEIDDGAIRLDAAGAQLCGLGMMTGDQVRLIGCERDSDCSTVGESCTVHPEAPSGVLGMCMPSERAIDLTGPCKRIMTSFRRYTAVEVGNDHAVLVPRPLTLLASPIQGCTDPKQCRDIEDEVLTDLETRNELEEKLVRHPFVCEVDPGMGGPARCIVSCMADSDCDPGAVCEGGRCYLGPVPPAVCVEMLQRYEPRSGDSFVVTSSAQSFPHRVIEDPLSGLCIDDSSRSPLIGNRIRRIEPPCTDLSVTGVGPNPCHLTGLEEPYRVDAEVIGLRSAYGMRIRGLGFSFDLTDVGYRLKTVPGVLVSSVSSGFNFRFTIGGGFIPHTTALQAPFPERVRSDMNGTLWVVDSGDVSGGISRGQVLNVGTTGGIGQVLR